MTTFLALLVYLLTSANLMWQYGIIGLFLFLFFVIFIFQLNNLLVTYQIDDYELINYEQKVFDKEKIASILENRHNKIKVDIEDPINNLYVELNV